MKAATIPPKAAWIKPTAILPSTWQITQLSPAAARPHGKTHHTEAAEVSVDVRVSLVTHDALLSPADILEQGCSGVPWGDFLSGAFRFLSSILPSSLPYSCPASRLGDSLQSLYLSKAPHTARITVKEWCRRDGKVDVASGRGGCKEIERHEEKRRTRPRKNKRQKEREETV